MTYNAISLSELKETNLIPFFDIIQAKYPESNITENTEVIVTSLEYLGHVAQIMATTDMRTMNGYLIWTLVRNYIPYLSDTFTSVMDTFNTELFGIQKPLERWEICSRLVMKFMGFAADSLITNMNPITENSIKIINDTFASIVNVAKKKLDKFQNNQLLYKHLQSKLFSLRLQIGIPESAKENTFLKEYYTSLETLKGDLFQSVKNAIEFHKKLEERQLNKQASRQILQYYKLADVSEVKYFPSLHTVIIPRSLLLEPLFEDNYPSSIIYGRLGVEIAEAVVSSVLPYGSLWTSDRKILSPYHMTVNESIKTVQPTAKCLVTYIQSQKQDIPYATMNERALRILTHLSAVNIAKEALQLRLEKTEHVHQPSLEEYEDIAIFFLSYAQTQCSQSTGQFQLYQDIVHFELPQRSRLHLTWTQIVDFPEVLKCSVKTQFQCPEVF